MNVVTTIAKELVFYKYVNVNQYNSTQSQAATERWINRTNVIPKKRLPIFSSFAYIPIPEKMYDLFTILKSRIRSYFIISNLL